MHALVIDQRKLDSFLARAVGDLSAGYGGVMVSLGHKLGLYKAMCSARDANRQSTAIADAGGTCVRMPLVEVPDASLGASPNGHEHSPLVLGREMTPCSLRHLSSIVARMSISPLCRIATIAGMAMTLATSLHAQKPMSPAHLTGREAIR